MRRDSNIGPSGSLALKVFPALPPRPLRLLEMLALGLPRFNIDKEAFKWRFKNLPNFWRGFWRIAMARLFRFPHIYGQTHLRIFRANGEIVDLGVASLRVVTNAGVNFLVDGFLGTAMLPSMKYHGFGSGIKAEEVLDETLATELTTAYAVNGTRVTGSQAEGATPNIYRTVATFTPDAAASVSEHGIFNTAAAGTGVLWDRTSFSVVNLNGAGDALQATYDCTFAAGS